jgi:hypothetical protein
MDHIYNLSAIKEKMDNKPRAQRIQEFMNKNEFDKLSIVQAEEIIRVIESECVKTVSEIRSNIY